MKWLFRGARLLDAFQIRVPKSVYRAATCRHKNYTPLTEIVCMGHANSRFMTRYLGGLKREEMFKHLALTDNLLYSVNWACVMQRLALGRNLVC